MYIVKGPLRGPSVCRNIYPTPSPWTGYTPCRAIPSHGSMWGFLHIAASRLRHIFLYAAPSVVRPRPRDATYPAPGCVACDVTSREAAICGKPHIEPAGRRYGENGHNTTGPRRGPLIPANLAATLCILLKDLFEALLYVGIFTPHHRRGRDIRPAGLSRHTARCGASYISPLRGWGPIFLYAAPSRDVGATPG